MIIRLDAGHDRSGTPRRVYVHIVRGNVRHVWDEDYQGWQAVPPPWRSHARSCPTFATTPGEYRTLLREWAQ